MFTLIYMIDNGSNNCFTLKGCVIIDTCLIIISALLIIISIMMDIADERRSEEMAKNKGYKVVYECDTGAVIYVYAEQQLYVFERIYGRLTKSFEVPSVHEGVEYLRSLY